MVRKKFNPQKLPKGNMESPYCECPKYIDSEKLFEDNVRDITKSLIIIMIVCGIHECKANSTRQVVINIFKHYNASRHRPNCAEPPKKMCKRNVLFCLAKHCLMTLVEAQLTYYIIKYALKAYFGALPQNCVKNPIMDLQIICEQEAAWKRAAQRTIKIYAECEGLMQPLVHKYNDEIKAIYRRLFDGMKKRAEPLEVPQCKFNCQSCVKLEVPTTSKQAPAANQSKVENEQREDPFANFPKCCKCKFPLDLCDCKVNPKSGKLCVDCSQGPFVCDWYRVDKEQRVKAKEHICPVDCGTDSSEDDECTCVLPQFSDCEIDETCTDDDECNCASFNADEVCVEDSESDDEEVTAKMEGYFYCCHMPVCDRTINMESVRRPAQAKRDNDIFVEFQEVPPAKNIKNVKLPPDVPKKRKVRPAKEKSATDMDKNKQGDKGDKNKQVDKNKNKQVDIDKNKQTGKDMDNNKDKDKNKDMDKDKNKDTEKDKNKSNTNDVAKLPGSTTKTDKADKKVEPKGTAKEDKTIGSNVPSAKDGNSPKSDTVPLVKQSDALRPVAEKNTTNVEKIKDNMEPSTSKPFASEDKKGKPPNSVDEIESRRVENSKRRKSQSGATARMPGKTKTTTKKLPCCKCKKGPPKCKKLLHCKPLVKNRVVPAPNLC